MGFPIKPLFIHILFVHLALYIISNTYLIFNAIFQTYPPSKCHESLPYSSFEEYTYPIIILVVQLFYYLYLNFLILYSSLFLNPLRLHSKIK